MMKICPYKAKVKSLLYLWKLLKLWPKLPIEMILIQPSHSTGTMYISEYWDFLARDPCLVAYMYLYTFEKMTAICLLWILFGKIAFVCLLYLIKSRLFVYIFGKKATVCTHFWTIFAVCLQRGAGQWTWASCQFLG